MTAQRFSEGQVEISETIIVLFIAVIIILFGMIFYFQYYTKYLGNVGERFTEQKYNVLLASISSMPELKCSFLGNEEQCIDILKVYSFKEGDYFNVLGYSNITIEQVYPEVGNTNECTAIRYQDTSYPDNCMYWKVYVKRPLNVKKSVKIETPISLYFADLKEYRIGKLVVEFYK